MGFNRRQRWIRLRARLMGWICVVGAIVVAVRLTWGWEASARMAAVQREFASANVQSVDGNARTIPDEQNAAVVLTRAILALRMEGLESPFRGEGRMFPFSRGFMPPLDVAQMRSIVAANGQTIRLIDKAAGLKDAQWPVTPWGPGQGAMGSPAVNANYALRALLRNGAELSHLERDNVAAIGYLQRLLETARIIDASPDLSSHLVAAGMRSEVAGAIDRWNLGGDGAAPALAAERGLLEAILRNETSAESIAKSFDAETGAYARWSQDALPGMRDWWLRPLAVDAFARRLALQMKLAPAARAKNYQELMAVHLPARAEGTNLDAAVAVFSVPRLEIVEIMRIYFRSLTDMHASSILLAAHLYRAEEGKLPAKLGELVPKYLAAEPVDPYDGAGQPMKYRVDAGGASVWSVGENGKDDKGTVGTMAFMGPMGPGFGRRYAQLDIVYGAAWRAAAVAATAP